MILVGREILTQFTEKHTDAKGWIQNWVADVEGATWKTPVEMKARYSKASILANNQVYFDVKGNSYRLLVTINYAAGVIKADWAGTHAEYDKR